MSVCFFCGVRPDTQLYCNDCKKARYCDAKCQTLDWRSMHKQECRDKGLHYVPIRNEDGVRLLNSKPGKTAAEHGLVALSVIRDAAYRTARAVISKGFRLDPNMAVVLKDHEDGIGRQDDPIGWRAAAARVKSTGGQIVFGWGFFENEHAVCAKPRVAWFDGELFWNASSEETRLFCPDKGVAAAFRSADATAPPTVIYWK